MCECAVRAPIIFKILILGGAFRMLWSNIASVATELSVVPIL